MTADQLASMAGVALALIMGYIPGVKDWYDNLTKEQRAATMGILLIVIAAVIFVGSCTELMQFGITCDKQGATQLIGVVIAALIANQGTFMLAVRPFKKSKTLESE